MNWLTKLRDGFKEKSAFSNARQKIDAVNNYIVRRPMMSPEANPLSYLEIAEELLTNKDIINSQEKSGREPIYLPIGNKKPNINQFIAWTMDICVNSNSERKDILPMAKLFAESMLVNKAVKDLCSTDYNDDFLSKHYNMLGCAIGGLSKTVLPGEEKALAETLAENNFGPFILAEMPIEVAYVFIINFANNTDLNIDEIFASSGLLRGVKADELKPYFLDEETCKRVGREPAPVQWYMIAHHCKGEEVSICEIEKQTPKNNPNSAMS